MDVVELSVNFGGRTLTLETGKLAKQADGSVICRCGDTVVLVAVVSAKTAKENQDFFPLTVDFQEKFYAAGRFPGGFFKREGMPPISSALTARLIDRPCRPLFPEDYLADTNVTVTVLSHDGINDPGILGSIGASAALHISDIPFGGPVGTLRVAMVNGDYICNPTPEQLTESRLDLLVSGVKDGVVMVEGLAKEVTEKEMVDALEFARSEMQEVIRLQDELREKTGNRKKRDYAKPLRDDALKAKMRNELWPLLEKAFSVREKLDRYKALDEVKKSAREKFSVAEPQTSEDVSRNKLVDTYISDLKASFARELTVNTKKRIDGRDFTTIRPISCETGLLPRVHGSGLFTRGETQVLATVTLGTKDDEQMVDALTGKYYKAFLLHYNFPPFSVGEARPLRPPGRREHGHGMLAERALSYIIPTKEQFPYIIRIVSEVLESNGSSSMATVCSGSMALMDAGVPIPKPVAGVAMGLIKEGDKVAVLSDILGDEDHLGDMDFKVCGTAEGITAFQMDLKIAGVSREIMEQALAQAREGRLHILGEMNKAISAPRAELSQYAPRIFTMKVKPENVRVVIGSGGKTIRSIVERTGVKIDIEDDGTINIASVDGESAQKAMSIINQLVEEAEPGKTYEGRVSRIADFGAFIEIIPGTDGLCHVSELAHYRVSRVEDILKEGDIVKVKCLEVDSYGKIRLSRKALLPKDASEGPPEGEGRSDRPGRDRQGREESRSREGGGRGDSRSSERGARDDYRTDNRGSRADDRSYNRDDNPPQDRGPRGEYEDNSRNRPEEPRNFERDERPGNTEEPNRGGSGRGRGPRRGGGGGYDR